MPVGSHLLNGVAYTDYESLIINPETKTIYSYTVGGGWHPLTTITATLVDPSMTLVPKGLFRCK